MNKIVFLEIDIPAEEGLELYVFRTKEGGPFSVHEPWTLLNRYKLLNEKKVRQKRKRIIIRRVYVYMHTLSKDEITVPVFDKIYDTFLPKTADFEKRDDMNEMCDVKMNAFHIYCDDDFQLTGKPGDMFLLNSMYEYTESPTKHPIQGNGIIRWNDTEENT